MRICVAVCLVLAACGRFGFGDVDSDALIKHFDLDGDIADAAPTVDVPPGSGTYTVTDGTATYVPLAGGTLLFGPGADEQTAMLSLPFAFVFYGVSFASVTVSVNGFVTFDAPPTGTDSWQNDCPIDTTPPDAAIYVFWDDLFVNTNGAITYLAAGTAPDRTFTIEWRDLSGWYLQGNSYFDQKLSITQAIVLHENGVIDLTYGPRTVPVWNRDCGLDRYRGCSATVGIEASGSTAMHMVQCGTAAGAMTGYTPLDPDRLITFTPM